MNFPDFFNDIPTIEMHDALAELLGACDKGMITYTYPDVVKLAGHSCPTVAGAYLTALEGLNALFPETVPERGAVEISFQEARDAGVTGIITNVLSYITGAAGEEGFKGLKGVHRRHGLLHFNQSLPAPIVMGRTDIDRNVALSYDPSLAVTDPIPHTLLEKIATGSASIDEQTAFAHMWQENVRRIFQQRNTPGILTVTLL